MQVQLICRSDKKQEVIAELEEPFEYFGDPYKLGNVILVPTQELHDYVCGHLFLMNQEAKVICIPPGEIYSPHPGNVPYALVTEEFTAKCDPTYPEHSIGNLDYYFIRKNVNA